MGFEKWIYRNGFGSPGHTARSLVKLYHKINEQYDCAASEEDIYVEIYQNRTFFQNTFNYKGGLLNHFDDKIGVIIQLHDMPLFVFAIETLETKQFRNGVTERSIDIILEVIREEVEKTDRSLIKLEYGDFRNKAILFFNIVFEFAKSI